MARSGGRKAHGGRKAQGGRKAHGGRKASGGRRAMGGKKKGGFWGALATAGIPLIGQLIGNLMGKKGAGVRRPRGRGGMFAPTMTTKIGLRKNKMMKAVPL